MKKNLLLLTILFLSLITNAQVSINNYNYTTSNSASLNRSNGSLIDDIDMTTGTTVVLGGSAVTNTTSSFANLNFDFYSGGQRFTNFTVTPNGWVGLGGGVAPTILWSGAVFGGTRLAPFLGPLLNTNTPPLSSMTTSSIGRVHYKLIGTSPSRIGVIEFLRMSINSSVVDDTNTFQVRLYESNGAIEYVYGRMKITAGAPLDFNIGFKIASGAHSVNATNNTSSTTSTTTNNYTSNTFIPNLHNYTGGSQRAYRFTPTPPNPPTNFNITNITNSAMTLTWTDASNETGYALYRSVDGGSTYTFVQQLAANTTIFNATGLPSNTDVYWRLFSFRESLSAQQDNVGTTLASSVITSVADGNWNNTATWSTGTIPNANDSVLISAGDTVLVNINNATSTFLAVDGALHFEGAAANILNILTSLQVNSTGAVRSLTTTTGNNTLSVGGASTASTTNGGIINNGIIDIDNGTNGVALNMFGNGNATISGSPTIFQLRSLQLQKNNNINNIVEVLTPFTVFVSNNASTLNINSGTLKISCPLNITPYGSTFGSTIVGSTNAKLWMNHSGAIINSTITPPGFTFTVPYNLTGELQMDSGTLNIGNGNSNLTLNNTFLRMNGGTINILGGFSHNNTGTLVMTGGNININPISGANALPNTTAALLFGANSNVNWTGGTINVISPQTLNNNTSVNILAGGVKSITGGLLKIGNGLQNGTAASALNTAGFGLTSTVPLYNVTLDCRFDLSSGRLARIIGTFIVGNNLTIESNTSLLPASGVTGGNLTLLGNLVLNGQIIGNFPVTSAPIVGLVNFNGSVNQTISGAGTFNNLANLTINNPNGVTSSLTSFGKAIRVNLLRGVLTTNGSLIIGSTISRGTVQIGGVDELTPAGSFNVIPLFDPTFTSHRFIYAPSSSSHQTGSYNEMPTGSIALSSLTITDLNGLTTNRNVTVLDTLNLGSANLNIGNNNLNIGSNITQTGLLVRSSGYVQMGNNGTFGRWYATSSILDNSVINGFPILSSNQDRSVTLNSDGNPITTGGNFVVRHINVSGNTNISPSVLDGGDSINRISNSNWIFNSSGITVPSFFGLQISANLQGLGAVSSLAQLRFMKPSLSSGGTSTGTGSLNAPVISRLFSQIQVLGGIQNDTFYVGVNTASNSLTPTFLAVANGSWDNPLTWNNNAVPTSSNTVVIPSPFIVNLNTSTGSNACDSIAILSGGTLSVANNTLNITKNILCEGNITQTGGTINTNGLDYAGVNISASTGSLILRGGTFTIGNTGGSNRSLLVNGTLTVSDTANLNVNGNVLMNSTATFNQSGGNITIDGNSGTAFTSTLQGIHLLDINTNNVNCTAGNILFVDPPHVSLSVLSTHTLRINATSNTSAFSGSHTVIFGNGSSSTTGNNSGFNVDNRKSGIVPIQNVIINAGNASGRWVSPSFSSGSFGMYMKGNVTINSGSELRQTNASQLVIGGNLVNNGILTNAQTLTFGGLGYAVATSQTISGTGVFRNATSAPTAEFKTLNIDNGGTTFNFTNTTFRVSTLLGLLNGKVDAVSNTFKILSTGNITRTSGYISNGSLELNFPIGVNVSKTYFVGSNTGYAPVILTFPTVSTAGDFRVTNSNTDHPQISAGCLNNEKSINKNWEFSNVGTLPFVVNANLSYLGADIDSGTTISNIIGKTYNGSTWSNTSLSSVSGTNTVINGITSNGFIQLGESASTVVTVSITSNLNNICSGTGVTFTAVSTSGGLTPVYQWKKNGLNVGSNSVNYLDNNLSNNDTIICQLTSSLSCAIVPTVTSNFVVMNVSSPTVGGVISGSTTICSGTSPSNLTLSGFNGNILRWEVATAPFTSWNNISNTTSTLSTGNLFQNTRYRALIQSGVCAELYSDTANINVSSGTVSGSVSGGTAICSGSTSGILTLSGNVGSVLNWESSIAPFSSWTPIVNTNSTYTSGALTQTTQFRAILQSGVCPSLSSSPTTVSVNNATIAGNILGSSSVCSGSTAGTLTLNGTNGSVVRWESAIAPYSSWTQITNTSLSLSPGILTQTTKYRALVQSGVCLPIFTDTATVTISTVSVGGSVIGGTTICAGSTSGLLQLSGNTGNVLNWESAVSPFTTWTSIANLSTIYTSGALTQTTQFRAVVLNGSCSNATSSSTTVTVNSTSVGGSISGSTSICSGSTGGTLNLSGQNGTILRWEKTTSPFTTWTVIANTTDSLITGNLIDSTKYRAIVQNGNCSVATSSIASVYVIPSTIAGTINGPSTLCAGSNPGNLILSGNTGNVVRWESAVSPFSTFTTIANTTNSYSPGALTQTTHFRAVVQSGSCTSATTNALVINISSSVSGGNVSAPFSSVCTGITPTQSISLNGFSGTVTSWQLATGTAPYTWTNISGSANLSSIIPSAATVNTAYRALVSSGSCGSAVSDSLVVLVNSLSVAGTISSNSPVCINSNATLTLTGNNGNIIRWESAISPFTSWTNITSTSNPYTSASITDSTQFRVVVKNGVCPEVISSQNTVVVNTNTSWNGSVSNSWHNAANWSCGIPTSSTDVIIGGNSPSFGQPQIFTSAFAKNIDIYGGVNPIPAGSLTVNSGANLSFFGNLSLNYGVNGVGNLFATNGTVNISGNVPQTISTPFHISLVKANTSIGNLNIGGIGDKTFDNLKTTVVNSLNLSNVNILLNDTLIISSTGSIIGGSSTSHIKTIAGRLIQNGLGATGRAGSVTFPVGTSTSFNPIVLTNSGTIDNFSVRVINNVFDSYIGETGSLFVNNNAVNKTWFIKKETVGGSNSIITLQWNSLDELSGFSNANSYVSRNSGSAWFASASGSASGTNPFTRTLTGVNTFNAFGVGSGGTLPVKLISFAGSIENKITYLTWATSSEINNKGFEVERSFNGVDFEKVGYVKGEGNSNDINNYSFIDDLSTNNYQLPTIYYRLKQLDFDGNFEYSNTIVVKQIKEIVFENNIVISPNPFNNELQVTYSLQNATTVNLILIDAVGRQVLNKTIQSVKGTNNVTINDLELLKAGVYFARIESDGIVSKSIKMIKH